MKKAFIAFSILTSVALFASAHAQRQYDYDLVGPREDPFAKYRSVSNGDRCGPQGNGDYILCESTGGLISQTQKKSNIAAFLRELYVLAFILAGTVAFIRIVYGGILYSWSGVVDRKKEAISIFKNVAIGMALLMSSYVILNTINPALTILALPNITMGVPQSSLITTKGLLGEGATPIGMVGKAIESIRQENVDRVNALDIYNSGAMERQATINLITDQMQAIDIPQTPAEEARFAELQKMLIQVQADEAETRAAANAVTNTPPKQFQRTKTAP